MSDVVWEQTVDNNEYQCKVVRVDGQTHEGELVVTRDGDVIHREQVGLAYGAIFGPDVEDVATWQDRCIQVIDDPDQRVT